MAELRDKSVSTVLLGRFNPLIFSPDWLVDNGVIGPVEAEEARTGGVEIMSPSLTSIKFGSMKLLVEEERFMLLVGDEPFVRAKDFPASCFSLLRHTPVHAAGFNYNVVLVGKDDASWHRFGDRLAPKEPWGDFARDSEGERIAGLRSMVMERRGSDEHKGYTRFGIEAQEGAHPSAMLTVNTHYQLGDATNPQNGAAVLSLLRDVWDMTMTSSTKLVAQMKDLADAV